MICLLKKIKTHKEKSDFWTNEANNKANKIL